MRKELEKLFDSFNRLVDWFIPAEIAGDRNMRRQARLFLVSHIFGPFLGISVPAALYALDPTQGAPLAIVATAITAFWIFPFLLKYLKTYNLLAILSIQNLMFCVMWGTVICGGIASPTLPWFLTIPLLSFFYLGSSPDIRWLVLTMFAVNLAAFYAVISQMTFGQSHASNGTLELFGVISTVAAALYVAMMALFYAKALATQAELELEMRNHADVAEDLRRSTAAAEMSGSIKDDFLVKIGHELRVPLTTIIGFSTLLADDDRHAADPQDYADLQAIHADGFQLLRLLNDLFDLSKIEAGRMEIFSDCFSPADLLRDAAQEMTSAAEANENSLVLEIDATIGVICSDMRKVRIVLLQLLSNAIQFTHGGTITISSHTERATGLGDERFVFSVRDTGQGIAPNKMPTLFERFALNDDTSASRYGGTGLGLALSRKLCLLMGGDISVETTLGEGSCFTVWLPSEPIDAERSHDWLGSRIPGWEARGQRSSRDRAVSVQAAA